MAENSGQTAIEELNTRIRVIKRRAKYEKRFLLAKRVRMLIESAALGNIKTHHMAAAANVKAETLREWHRLARRGNGSLACRLNRRL